MNHTEAAIYLTDSEHLTPEVRAELRQHVDGCGECQEWVATFELLAREVGGSSEAGEHLSSEEIVAFALTPEAFDDEVHSRLAEHLDQCQSCQDESRLIAVSIDEARQSQPLFEPSHEPQTPSHQHRAVGSRLAWAASIAALVIVASTLYNLGSEPDSISVQGERLEGIQFVQADREILIQETAIQPGASVTVSSGQVVAFGDGFSIGSGASLRVLVDNGNQNGT